MNKVQRWIVKDSKGRLQGPYTTQQILQKISFGEIGGEEYISPYPGTNWVPISQEPDFFDHLLKVLANLNDDQIEVVHEEENFDGPLDSDHAHPPSDDRNEKKESLEDKTVNIGTDKSGHSETVKINVTQEKKEKAHGPTSDHVIREPKTGNRERVKEEKTKRAKKYKKKSSDDDVIELEDQKELDKKEKLKQAKIPLISLVVIVVIIGVWLFLPNSNSRATKLIFPKKKSVKISKEEEEALIQKAELNIQKDTHKNYVNAQSYIVKSLEGNIKNTKSWALLCLTYLELWPYVDQSAEDYNKLLKATRVSRKLDSAGPNGSTCQAVNLILTSKLEEARLEIKSILDRYGSGQYPPVVFYYLKAIELASTGQNELAINYLDSAQKLWPSWLRPYVFQAQLYKKMQQYTPAYNVLSKVLRASPQHKVAQIELAELEFKNFGHLESAYTRLNNVLATKDLAPNSVMAKGFFVQAQLHAKYDNLDQALDAAKKAYQLDPGNQTIKNFVLELGSAADISTANVDVRQLIVEGDQFFRSGKVQAASANYKTAFEIDPHNSIAAYKAAQTLWELGFSEQAVKWLNKSIQADPKNIDAYILQAEYQAKRYNFRGARKVLAVAAKVSPKNYKVYRGYAKVELIRRDAKGAISFAQKALNLYSTDVETQIIMAKANLLLNQAGDANRIAFDSATKAIEIDFNNREAQIVYAQAYARQEGVDAGIHYLSRLINTYPELLDYRIALGKMLIDDQRYKEAVETLLAALNIQPRSKEAHLNLGTAYRLYGKFDYALKSYLKAAELDPADAEALFNAGLLYLQIQNAKQARSQFERAQLINPRYPLIHYYIGESLFLMKDYQGAIDEATKEIRVNPKLPQPYILIARAHTKMKNYSLCAQEYQKAIKISQLSGENYINVAYCYRLSGSLDEARLMLEKANKVESGNPLIHKEFGALFETLGEYREAIKSYETYLILDPAAKDRALIESRIRILGDKTL